MTYHSIFRPGLFDGQTILVTGGGTGIGRAVAHELASLGAHVVLAARTLEGIPASAIQRSVHLLEDYKRRLEGRHIEIVR